MLGLIGMGGIGKTMLAKALYDFLRSEATPDAFSRQCFLPDIHAARRNLGTKQSVILRDLAGLNIQSANCDEGKIQQKLLSWESLHQLLNFCRFAGPKTGVAQDKGA